MHSLKSKREEEVDDRGKTKIATVSRPILHKAFDSGIAGGTRSESLASGRRGCPTETQTSCYYTLNVHKVGLSQPTTAASKRELQEVQRLTR